MRYNTLMADKTKKAKSEEKPEEPASFSAAELQEYAAASPYNQTVEDSAEEVVWTASEFVAHDKSAGWYTTLALVAVLVAVGVYFLTRDYVSAGVVIFAAIVFGIFGSHKPRQLQYRLNHRGITIDKKNYSFNEYRSFSVIQEEAFSSITLMPLKRFAPPLSLYFAPEDEEQIINILSATLPFEERNRDAVDALMHRIRF